MFLIWGVILSKKVGYMMNVGDVVKINKCDVCSGIVGKTAKVKGFGDNTVLLNFGKGRPQANRPNAVSVDDVSVVKN